MYTVISVLLKEFLIGLVSAGGNPLGSIVILTPFNQQELFYVKSFRRHLSFCKSVKFYKSAFLLSLSFHGAPVYFLGMGWQGPVTYPGR